jgi:hypothetical protein
MVDTMTDEGNLLVTTADREINPKAVFIGEENEIINPLALKLAETNVDLFTGKNLSDAFFGDYFFFIGDLTDVKEFLEKNGRQLPKTLLLLTVFSGSDEISKVITAFPQIKAITIDSGKALEERSVNRIIEFFFGGSDQLLLLAKEGKKKLIKPLEASPQEITKPPVKEMVPLEISEPKDENKPSERAYFTSEPVGEPEINQLMEAKKSGSENELVNATPPAESLSVGSEEKGVITADLPEVSRTAPQSKNQVGFLYEADPKQSGKNEEKASKRRRGPLLVASLVALVAFVLFPVLLLTGEVTFGGYRLNSAKKSLQAGQFDAAEKQFKQAAMYLGAAESTSSFSSGLLTVIGLRSFQSQMRQGLLTLSRIADAGAYLSTATRDARSLIRGVAGQEKGVAFGQLISSVKGTMALADGKLAEAQAEMKTASLQTLFSRPFFSLFADKFKSLSNQVDVIRDDTQIAQRILSIAPEFIGLYGERQYLVLFQNNMELRPTGGFIGSFGLLDLREGELKDFKIEDVYTADGALKGHIDPPEAIRVHLGQEHWYLRDSNWDPDFSKSAARAAWFLNKELDTDVDGVIAIDLNFVQYLLQSVGPLNLADYNQKVTGDNLFSLAHAEAETDFFPGSTQKKDFLSAVGRGLMDVLLAKPQNFSSGLMSKLRSALEEKHALVYLASPIAQKVVSELGWGGEVFGNAGCDEASCWQDRQLLVDANLGVNKVNYFVTREQTDTIEIGEGGGVKHELTVKYRNEADASDPKLGGGYKNYLRLYVPKDAEVTRVTQDGLAINLSEAPLL